MKLIIAGSREFNDYSYLERKLDEMLFGFDYKEIIIISGACKGVDILGERYALENSLPVIKFYPDWDKYGKSAGFRRNREMAHNATHCVVFQVNNSKGSQLMIDLAKQYNLELTVFNLLPVEYSGQGTQQKTQLLTLPKKDSFMSFSKSKLGYDLPCFPKDTDAPIYLWRSRLDQVDQIPKIAFTKAKFIEIPQGVLALFEVEEAPKGTKVNVNECPYVAILLHSKEYKVKNWDTQAQDVVQPSEAENFWVATLKKEGFTDNEANIGEGHFWYLSDLSVWADNLEFCFKVSFDDGTNPEKYDAFNAIAKTVKDGCGGSAGGGKTYKSLKDRIAENKPLVKAEIAELSTDSATLLLLDALKMTSAEYLTILFK